MSDPQPDPAQPQAPKGEPWYYPKLRAYEKRLTPIRQRDPEIADALEGLLDLVGDIIVHGFIQFDAVVKGEQDLAHENEHDIAALKTELGHAVGTLAQRVVQLEANQRDNRHRIETLAALVIRFEDLGRSIADGFSRAIAHRADLPAVGPSDDTNARSD